MQSYVPGVIVQPNLFHGILKLSEHLFPCLVGCHRTKRPVTLFPHLLRAFCPFSRFSKRLYPSSRDRFARLRSSALWVAGGELDFPAVGKQEDVDKVLSVTAAAAADKNMCVAGEIIILCSPSHFRGSGARSRVENLMLVGRPLFRNDAQWSFII